MKSLNTTLALSALGIALLATPALAQQQPQQQQLQPQHRLYMQQGAANNYRPNYDPNYVGTYPNGATRSGSAESVESGAEFNLLKN
jgi:hypothetical protein